MSILLLTALLAQASDLKAEATRFLERCRDGQYEEAVKPFDATMARAMPAPTLKKTWEGVVAQFGQLKTMGDPREESQGQYKRDLIRCEFEKIALDAIVAFDAKGKIAGFFLVPPSKPEEGAKSEAEPKAPPYFNFKDYWESEVEVGAKGWPLKGTFTRPKNIYAAPLVVLVHGSGPHDRDETIGPNAPFRDLARGLASKGIATLRYDKRTKVYGQKMMEGPREAMTVDAEVTDDALAAVAKARALPGIDPKKIFVLGHSLGGSMAPEVALRDGKLRGIILLAASARPPDAVVLEQLQYLVDNDPSQAEASRKLRTGLEADFARLRKGDVKPDEIIMGVPISYWKSWLAVDPAKTAAALKGVLMLILRGGCDYQVTQADVDAFQAALKGRKDVTVKLYPSLSHLFQAGEGKGLPADYAKKGYVEAKVIDDIAAWVKARR